MGTKSYLIGQGYDNLKKHGGKTLSTMLIICATMLILGIFIIAFINIGQNIKVITENQGLQAFISDDVSENEIEGIATKIQQIVNVKEITYRDKTAAFQDAKSTLKEYQYLLDGLEQINPFPRSFVIVFENLSSTKEVKAAVESVEGIYKVGYNETIIDAVASISKIGNVVIIGVGAIMMLISVFIISNTIKLAVYSNKREIYIMKYIGATSKFIKAPFIVEGIIMGLASAVLSWVIISLGYVTMYTRLPKIGENLGVFGFVGYSEFWHIMLISFVFLGIILGGFGSSLATMKYLKEFKPVKIMEDEREKKDKERKIKNNKIDKTQSKEAEKRKKKEKVQKEKQTQEEMIKKRRARRLTSILLILVIVSPNIIAQTEKEIREEIETIKEQQDAVTKKYKELENDLKVYEKDIEKLDGEVEKYSKELNTLTSKVSSISEEVTVLETELQAVSTNYEATNDLLNTRLRALYENGFVNFWEILFSSSNTTDFLAKYNVLVSLIEYDKKMLTAMQNKKEYINNLKESAELRKLQVQQVNYDVEKSKESLEMTKSNKELKVVQIGKTQEELKAIEKKLKAELSKQLNELKKYEQAAKNYTGVFKGQFTWPVGIPSLMTTSFGEVYFRNVTHNWGIDLAKEGGAPIIAIADGKVIGVVRNSANTYPNGPRSWGSYVIIAHGKSEKDGKLYTSQYSHLNASSISVKIGDYVSKGQQIAFMGNTGYSSGTHLDFILKRNGSYVNPVTYIDHKKVGSMYAPL